MENRFEDCVSVETPDHVEFQFELAGLGTRMMAYLIDLSIRMGASLVLGLLIVLSFGQVLPGVGMGMMLIALFAIEWGYHTLFEWLWHGVTPGKRALSIRVVRTDGVAIDLVRAAMRNLLRAADIFPFCYATGIAVMFFSRTDRRLGDLAADTMVVREKPVRLGELPRLPEGASDFSVSSRVIEGLSERDLSLIDEFFRRRNLFSAERAAELAALGAYPIQQKLSDHERDPERLLAAVLLGSRELRSSWGGMGLPSTGERG